MVSLIFRLLLFCIFFAVFTSPSFGKELSIVTSEFPPFNYSENGQVKGVSTAVVQALLDKAGIKDSISVYPWSRAYKTATDKKNTLIYTIARTPAREDLFEWIGVIVEGDTFLFSSRDRDDIVINTLDDAKKYRIGVVRNGIRAKYLYKNGFTQLEEVKDTMANAKKMKLGWLDLWVEEENAAYFSFEQMGLDPHENLQKIFQLDMKLTGYLAMSKGSDANIVRALKIAFIELKDSGEYERIMVMNSPVSKAVPQTSISKQ